MTLIKDTLAVSRKMGIRALPAIEHDVVGRQIWEIVPETVATLEDELSRYSLSEQDLQATEAYLDRFLFLTVTFFHDRE